MATIYEKKTAFTVSDAAEKFGRTTARIRQICINNEIGKLIEHRIRILTVRDMTKIGKIIEENGHSRNSEKN